MTPLLQRYSLNKIFLLGHFIGWQHLWTHVAQTGGSTFFIDFLLQLSLTGSLKKGSSSSIARVCNPQTPQKVYRIRITLRRFWGLNMPSPTPTKNWRQVWYLTSFWNRTYWRLEQWNIERIYFIVFPQKNKWKIF